MTEKKNTDSSNLCATEDEFEKFQSVSMYEEDEYITLSDIVSPPNEPSHLPSDINEIPYDNEVVLSTNMDDEVINNVSETGMEHHSDQSLTELTPIPAVDNFDTQHPSEDITNIHPQIPTSKPKGRKKKSLGNESFQNCSNNETKADVVPPVREKRTRKPKVLYNEDEMIALQTPKSKTSRKTVHKKTPELPINAEPQTCARQSNGRRGRPRKTSLESSYTNPSEGETNTNKKSIGRRGRPKKRALTDVDPNETLPSTIGVDIQSDEPIPSSEISTCLSESGQQDLGGLVEQFATENTVSETVDDASDNLPLSNIGKKRPRKRGKSKKIQPEELNFTENDQNISSENYQQVCTENGQQSFSESKLDDYDEDGDDMSLSQLKQICDTNGKTAENLDSQQLEPLGESSNGHSQALEVADVEQTTTESVVKKESETSGEQVNNNDTPLNSLLVEDTSKRPVRRKTKQTLHYDEGSDEDPFANMESESDDEPKSKRRGKRYYSDDEYVPGSNKKGKISSSDISDSDIDIDEMEEHNQKRKRIRKKSDVKSPHKKAKTEEEEPSKDVDITTIAPSGDILDVDDVEVCLQSSVIKANTSDDTKDPKKKVWGMSSEFESFIANKIHGSDLKIKKVSPKEQSQSTPLEIPVLSTVAKKTVEMCTQTMKTVTNTVAVQTATVEVPMKDNLPLKPEQSEKACEFLKSIVKTTSELGQLMTQKSEDFITKKINTENVTNTFKMDYCVKKSFLLLKLAKHNLIQMEEDLSKQYEEFLKSNGLSSCREEVKVLAPVASTADNDSDCEIVDEQPPAQVKTEKGKSKFNPKTVFLNKELSIKIAKKPAPAAVIENQCKEKLNVKGRHTVWISDSVMVKKVKPTQSFLAQDSRNKKPPDSQVTEKMVSDFFKNYYHQKVLSVCAPFTSREWLGMTRSYVCNYFFVKSDNFCDTDTNHTRDDFFLNNSENTTGPDASNDDISLTKSPETLFSLCTQTLQKQFFLLGSVVKENVHPISDEIADLKKEKTPKTLFRLCLNSLFANSSKSITEDSLYTNERAENEIFQVDYKSSSSKDLNEDSLTSIYVSHENESYQESTQYVNDNSLPTIEMSINETFQDGSMSVSKDSLPSIDISKKKFQVFCLQSICHKKIMDLVFEANSSKIYPNKTEEICYPNCEANPTKEDDELYPIISENELLTNSIEDLSCYGFEENYLDFKISEKVEYNNKIKSLFSLCVKLIQRHQKKVSPISHSEPNIKKQSPISLKHIALENLNYLLNKPSHDFVDDLENIASVQSHIVQKVKSLADICFENISSHFRSDDIDQVHETTAEEFTINSVNTLSEEAFLNIQITCLNSQEGSDYLEDEETTFDNDDNIYDDDFNQFEEENVLDETPEENNTEENSWVSQVQMKEFRSCFIPSAANNVEKQILMNEENDILEHPSIAQVKIEPVEETPEIVDPIIVKTEPVCDLNEMVSIPENVVTKREIIEESTNPKVPIQRNNSSSFDVDSFEAFVRTSKMMYEVNETLGSADEIFSQSALRVRRQYEPDPDGENYEGDSSMNLLVPHTFEPLNIETAKGSLMESSSGEEDDNKKGSGKKKPDKRGRGRPKNTKQDTKQNNKDVPSITKEKLPATKEKDVPPVTKEKLPATKEKDKLPPEIELAVLTRRMREKIRQEEKKIESSDSETETLPLTSRKEKERKEKNDKSKLENEDLPLTSRTEKERKENNEKSKLENEDLSWTSRKEKERKENKEQSKQESEDLPLLSRKEKDKKDFDLSYKSKSSKSSKRVEEVEDEIQCNNVDSTQQTDKSASETRSNSENDQQFTGFSAVDQNEIYSYQKYVKYVYDQILPKVTSEENNQKPLQTDFAVNDDRSNSPLINYDDPVEMLECEPTMPTFEDFDPQNIKQTTKTGKPRSKKSKVKVVPEESKVNDVPEDSKANDVPEDSRVNNVPADPKVQAPVFTERDGWHCYPIDAKETKLYLSAGIFLEKLPESFVETYFEYQNITDKDTDDAEVDRLINLNSLNRSSNVKDSKTRPKPKGKSDERMEQSNVCRSPTPVHPEHYDELEPSEDEGANVDDEIPPLVPAKASENSLAKNSLMNDEDSDTDLKKIKQEPDESPEQKDKPKKSKGKTNLVVAKSEHPESLMLTADKSLNKELNLLHAPIVLKEDMPQTSTGPATRNKNRTGTKTNSPRDKTVPEDDSSSEEEKQWVSTKEKLLKRMGKNKDTTSIDDAKRAKLVTEFIERRADKPDSRKRPGGGGKRARKSARKLLEREKQLRVLSHELFGETSDALPAGKASSQSFFKGRRNIRKVIDKKSLARSTVVANMEEFERKCRLNQRQTRLRELLGCEEGVNVLVINDEVCLEYDFVRHQPVVTVHPFFTKVMKAHQYEGVKFMWDACFETLEKIESGHPGGGCILAHCMGLGKTLQVLALLHTVLTHPRVGMQRVLVCCPLSTVLNWVDEIHKWIGPVTDQIKVFELSKLRKTYERAYQLEDWYSGGGIFIIGYELFRSLTTLDPELDEIRPTIINKIRTALLDPGPDIIVCDEGHLLKNDCSVLAVAMSRVVTKRRIVLTGTPMQNNLREYYCMVNFIKPNLLGTYSEYSNRFENPIMNGQHRDSIEEDTKLMKQRTHILHKVLEGCLQRQEASVLYPYLPKKHEYTVFISQTKCQWDLYKHYIQNYAKKSKQSILKDFHILQKIWSHPQVLHRFQMRTRDADMNKIKPEKMEDDLANEDLTATEDMKAADTEVWWLQYLDGGNMLDSLESSHKFAVVFRILEESIALGDKVLIFSTSLITMDSLEFFLHKINNWSLGQEYYRLDGSVPPEVRQKWCREFNAEHNHKTKLFLISTRAGSLGLNMVAANRVIILDTSWNPAHDIQSIFRVYRFGQKKDCYIYRLVAMGTMEQKIYERSVTKQAVSCRVVDEQQIDRHYNMAELTELYRFEEGGASVEGGLAVGVTDVALLRVARHAGLHAVHEHDSLLRGSSEQSLPEHERAAAWMQFQQEHAHKQIQNQLTSSFSLHIPAKVLEQVPGINLMQPPVVKQEDGLLVYATDKPPSKQTKKGKKVKLQPDEPPNPEAIAIEDAMVRKIMDILVKHKFQTEGPKEIAALVSNVRKIVAYGRIPEGSFNKELTQSIANVLLGQNTQMPALTDVLPPSEVKVEPVARRRGRPRKSKQTAEELTNETLVETPQEPVDTGGRRKAALQAEKQLSAINDAIIEIDCDDDWHADSDASAPEEIVPEAKPSKPKDVVVKKENVTQKDTQLQPSTDNNSILLSDDDEPQPKEKPSKKKAESKKKKAENKKGKAEPKKEKAEGKQENAETVPLHPSLLNNKNFIKIVAHTYLEGNPMLDEDAAMLAAQYSTQKALKEYESSGKPIVSGPIYDIAIQVLGKDIIEKLHKTNPVMKKTETVATEKTAVKAEPPPPEPKKPRVKAKGIAELTGKMMPAELTGKMLPAELTGKMIPGVGYVKNVAPPDNTQVPSVVPVGLFKSAGNMSMTTEEPLPSTSQAKEESILPDDDDVIISDSPARTPAPTILRRNSKPLILNSVIAKTSSTTPVLTPTLKPKPRTIKISHGQIIKPSNSVPVSEPMMNVQPSVAPPLPVPVPTSAPTPVSQGSTICLDSDEEETITPNVQPPPKRIAVKSTAKPVVPVSLRAANPHINPIPNLLNAQLQQPLNPALFPPNHKGYVVIPASSFARLPPGIAIPDNAKIQKIHSVAQPPPGIGLVTQQNMPQIVTSAPQNMNAYPQHITLTQNVPVITSQPNIVMTNPLPQSLNPIRATISGSRYTLVTSNMQNTWTPQSMPQTVTSDSMNDINTIPQNLSEINTVTNQFNPIPMNTITMNTNPMNTMPPNTNVTTTTPESILPNRVTSKTVCKPGDILQISKTGEVMILNRGGDDVAASTNAPSPVVEPPVDPVNTVMLDDSPPDKAQRQSKSKTYGPKRTRKISSSSSSDSSRSSSPKDPLDIFKDVVHIKAAEEFDKPSPVKTNTQSQIKDTNKGKNSIGNTNITKPSSSKTTPSTTPSKTNQAAKPPTRSQDKLMEQINKTDTILKKLNSFLGPPDKPKHSPASRSTANSRSSTPQIESVDLTESSSSKSTPKMYSSTSRTTSKQSSSSSTPSTSKPSSSTSKPSSSRPSPSPSTSTSNRKVLSLLSKDIQVGKTDSKPKSTTTWTEKKMEATTISGTSRNIIISGNGKAGLASADSAKKNIRVTNVEKIAPGAPAHKPWSDSKKRPTASTETNAPKKKKTEPMTLKDFDIDDIDDIIELE